MSITAITPHKKIMEDTLNPFYEITPGKLSLENSDLAWWEILYGGAIKFSPY